jgi:hypothetical protein
MLRGDEPTLQRLCSFVGVPYDPELSTRATMRVDEWHHRTDTEFDWRRALDHPATVELASRLGYDFEAVDERALHARYKEQVS